MNNKCRLIKQNNNKMQFKLLCCHNYPELKIVRKWTLNNIKTGFGRNNKHQLENKDQVFARTVNISDHFITKAKLKVSQILFV